ncbi:MAG: MFS transporter [Chloroflexi bacterium]|nr:MFS transporter [Chloroflexota bacterium]
MFSSLRKLHYAWVVLAAVMMVNAVASGLRLSFAVYIDPLVEQFGWSRGGISFAYTVQFLAAIPVVLGAGWLGERMGIRRIAVAGSLIATVGVLLTATVSQLWQFQLYYGVISGGIGTAIFISLLPVTVSQWFYRRLGLAMALMWTSLGWGSALMGPLMRWSIETFGWRQSFIVVGIVSGVIMCGAALLLRDRPENVGLTPYGGLPAVEDGPAPSGKANPGSTAALSISQVTGMASFWILVLIHAAGCVGHSVPLAHMVSIATFTGIPGLAAAGMLTISSLSSLISRFFMSLMAEAVGARWTLALALFSQTVPILLLLGAKDLWLFYTFAAIFGIGYGGEMVGFPIFNRQYYGYRAPLSTIYSYQMAGALVGMALGGWMGGALFDHTGAYTWTIWAATAAGLLGGVAALVLPRHHRH